MEYFFSLNITVNLNRYLLHNIKLQSNGYAKNRMSLFELKRSLEQSIRLQSRTLAFLKYMLNVMYVHLLKS